MQGFFVPSYVLPTFCVILQHVLCFGSLVPLLIPRLFLLPHHPLCREFIFCELTKHVPQLSVTNFACQPLASQFKWHATPCSSSLSCAPNAPLLTTTPSPRGQHRQLNKVTSRSWEQCEHALHLTITPADKSYSHTPYSNLLPRTPGHPKPLHLLIPYVFFLQRHRLHSSTVGSDVNFMLFVSCEMSVARVHYLPTLRFTNRRHTKWLSARSVSKHLLSSSIIENCLRVGLSCQHHHCLALLSSVIAFTCFFTCLDINTAIILSESAWIFLCNTTLFIPTDACYHSPRLYLRASQQRHTTIDCHEKAMLDRSGGAERPSIHMLPTAPAYPSQMDTLTHTPRPSASLKHFLRANLSSFSPRDALAFLLAATTFAFLFALRPTKHVTARERMRAIPFHPVTIFSPNSPIALSGPTNEARTYTIRICSEFSTRPSGSLHRHNNQLDFQYMHFSCIGTAPAAPLTCFHHSTSLARFSRLVSSTIHFSLNNPFCTHTLDELQV